MASASASLSQSTECLHGSEAILPNTLSLSSLNNFGRLRLHDRANSDTNLAFTDFLKESSKLTVDKTDYYLAAGDKLLVHWDIKEKVGSTDWIGLFLGGEGNRHRWIDYKNRGVNQAQQGELVWQLDENDEFFNAAVTKVEFRYYHGATGSLRATSPIITVHNPNAVTSTWGTSQSHGTRSKTQAADPAQLIRFTVQDMQALYLKKGMFFNPDPYVKLSVQPGKRSTFPRLRHHGQEKRSTIKQNTTSPVWYHEDFLFEALPTDVLEFEVKDKFAKSRPTISRFLGKLTVPVQRLVDRAALGSARELSFNLMRRNPSDNVSGVLTFSIEIDLTQLQSNHSSPRSSRRSLQNQRRVNSFATDHSPSPTNSPNSRRRKKRVNTDPGIVTNHVEATTDRVSQHNDTSAENDIGGSHISLSALSRGRIADSFEIEDESLLSQSPGSLNAIPNIECGEFASQLVLEAVDSSQGVARKDSRSNTSATPPSSKTQVGTESGNSGASGSSVSGTVPLTAEHLKTLDPMQACGMPPKSNVASFDSMEAFVGSLDNIKRFQGNSSSPESNNGENSATEQNQSSDDTHSNNVQRLNEEVTTEQSDRTELTSAQTQNEANQTQNEADTAESNIASGINEDDSAIDENSAVNSEQTIEVVINESEANISQTPSIRTSTSSERTPTPSASSPTPSTSTIQDSPMQTLSAQTPQSASDRRPNSSVASLSSQLADIPVISSRVSLDALHDHRDITDATALNNLEDEVFDGNAPTGVPSFQRLFSRDSNNDVLETEGTTHARLFSRGSGSVTIEPEGRTHTRLFSRGSGSVSTEPPPFPANEFSSPSETREGMLSPVADADETQGTTQNDTNAVAEGASQTNTQSTGAVLQQRSQGLDSTLNTSLSEEIWEPREGAIVEDTTVAPSGVAQPTQQEAQPNEIAQPNENAAQPDQDTSRLNNDEPEGNSQSRLPNGTVAATTGTGTGSGSTPTSSRRSSHHARQIAFQRVDPLPGEEPLPPGWEVRIDSHGRKFYIDHINRQTTWTRPRAQQVPPTGQAVRRVPSISSEQREDLDRRYRSIRRTINDSSQPRVDELGGTPPIDHATPAQSSEQPAPTTSATTSPQRNIDSSTLMQFPAIKFLTRPDLFSLIQNAQDSMAEYNRNSTLKHMLTKIRRDPQVFQRYQHNRDLVGFLNMFADPNMELPRGWEVKYDRSGKAFFINHTERRTTFIDPRLPVDVPIMQNGSLMPLMRQRSRSAGERDMPGMAPTPPPRPNNADATASSATAAVPSTYNERVVAFLKQPNIEKILSERHPTYRYDSSLKSKIAKIVKFGEPRLERLSNDVDLIVLLSMFENEIMSYVPPHLATVSKQHNSPLGSPQGSPALQRANVRVPAPYKRDFQAKLRNFHRKLENKGYGQGPGKVKLSVRRDHVLEDAYNKIMATSKKELQRSKLFISFKGEEGLDYGGPGREFFFLLSRELFNPYYGLFEYSANDTYTVQVSPMSAFVENAHEWFRFAGRVIALALIHQYLLDAFFTRPFYKALLKLGTTLSDVEAIDTEYHQSILWIKENDITDMGLDLTFSVNEEVFGQITERDLKPNGRHIPVTEKNKKDYIDRVVKWRVERGVVEQTESLVRGFYEVIDSRSVSVFDARELELVIAGIAEIDTADWRKHTEYRSGYHEMHPVVQWFWMAVERFDSERRLRLLQFVTGSSSVPYEGFAALRGSNGPRKFCIEKWGKISSLPRAHTCFNRIDLPAYNSFEMLFDKLSTAVEETSTFGIE